MRKNILFIALLSCLCAGLRAQAPKGIVINEENFPDSLFRYYVDVNWGRNKFAAASDRDSILTPKEISEAKVISLRNYPLKERAERVKNLKGIEFFTNLEQLYCSDEELTALDISALPNLKRLECSNNPLSSLEVSNNPELAELYCHQMQLSQLDVSNNMKLTSLECSYNKLTSLDVSKNTSLQSLSCKNNSISSLDYELPELSSLNLSNNPLVSVNLSAFPKLNNLWMQGTPVKKLDVTDFSQLSSLSLEDGQLEELTISGCPKLHDLRCQNNNLSVLNISGAENIAMLDCSNNQLEALDLTDCELVNYLYCNNNLLKKLQIPTKCYWIWCNDNYLTELEFSEGKSSCLILHCYGNFLTTDAVDKLIDALPVKSSSLGCTVFFSDARDEEEIAKTPGWKPECNEITSEQVKRGQDKGWFFKSYGNNRPKGINEIRAKAAPVIVSNTGSTLTVQGAEDGESITAYTLAGKQLGTAVNRNGQASLPLRTPADIIIVKVGENAIKVRVK